MGQDPSQIKQDIEETRGRMGETVEALGYKTDVSGRARDKVQSVTSKITGATPDGGDVKDGARRAAGTAQENPLGLAVGAAAAGFIAGMLIPSTRVEDEKIGALADDVKDKVKETGQEAVERGKQVAQQAAESAAETAREAGQEQAQEMRESASSGSEETPQPQRAAASS